MDHKQERLWVCNTHWVMNSNEKAIMKFQCAKTLFFLHWIETIVLKHKAPYREGDSGGNKPIRVNTMVTCT